MNRDTLVSRPENSDELRRRMLNALFAVALVLLTAFVVGCGGGEDDEARQRGTGNQTVGPNDTSGASAELPGSNTVGGSQLQTQTITVTVKESGIAMPTIMKPGPTTLNVVNAGQEKHGLTIAGNGQDLSLESDLDPGEAAQIEIDLQPGTYTVTSPLGDHDEKGTAMQITVQP